MTAPTVEDQVRSYLELSGHELELEVADLLSRNHWMTAPSAWYLDLDEQKGREMDVIATKPHLSIPNATLVVECKKSNKPWIFFTSTEETEIIRPNFLTNAWQVARKSFEERDVARFYHYLWKFSESLVPKIIAHSFTEYREKGEAAHGGAIFKAATSLAKASRYTLDQEVDFWPPMVVFPVLVVDAPVVQVQISEGERQIQQCKSLLLRFGYMSPAYAGRPFSIPIHVVRRDALSSFIDTLTSPWEKFCKEVDGIPKIGKAAEAESVTRAFDEALRRQASRQATPPERP